MGTDTKDVMTYAGKRLNNAGALAHTFFRIDESGRRSGVITWPKAGDKYFCTAKVGGIYELPERVKPLEDWPARQVGDAGQDQTNALLAEARADLELKRYKDAAKRHNSQNAVLEAVAEAELLMSRNQRRAWRIHLAQKLLMGI